MTRRILVTGGGRTALLLAAALAGPAGVVLTRGDYADEGQAPMVPGTIRITPDTCDQHRHPYRGKRKRQWR